MAEFQAGCEDVLGRIVNPPDLDPNPSEEAITLGWRELIARVLFMGVEDAKSLYLKGRLPKTDHYEEPQESFAAMVAWVSSADCELMCDFVGGIESTLNYDAYFDSMVRILKNAQKSWPDLF